MPSTVRFSQFNASLNRNSARQLVQDLSTPTNAQAKAVAETIQRTNPDVLLINEFDYVAADPLAPVRLLQQNYLSVSQNGAAPVEYAYAYIAPSNTGIASGFDLNNNGAIVTIPETPGYGDDSFGFGQFPGQFGMLVLSKYPIDTANVRTFQNFLWKDMPGNLLTNDPTVNNPATPVNENLNGFYSAEEQAILRLSSKSHWDVPILVNGEVVHALVSHPTPPVFDGPEDRNGKRNHDEIRFWSDYVSAGKGGYIYDDQGRTGAIAAGSRFVIMGDQNADPNDGDSYDNAILQLLQNPNLNTNSVPSSLGGQEQSNLDQGKNWMHRSNPNFDTADFGDTGFNPGNLRTDYVLPSSDLQIADSKVFWPVTTDPLFRLVGDRQSAATTPASDHSLVWVDVKIGATEAGKSIFDRPEFLGQTIIKTGFVPTGAAGTINGTAVPLGGLSGLQYDAAKNQYYAISDDRSEFAPARFYTFTGDPTKLSTNGVTFTNVTPLKDINGNFFAKFSLDPEDILLTNNGRLFISSEGEVRPDLGASRVTDPFIKEFNLTTGQEVGSLLIPEKFLPKFQDTNGSGVVDAGDTQLSGIRNNLAFESLTITPDQKLIFTATENALIQDGPITSPTSTSPARIIQYSLFAGQPEKEYLYEIEKVAIAPPVAGSFSTNGLVDLLAIDNRGTLLAVERSFTTGAPGTGNTIKIYEISTQGATDISAIQSLNSLSASDRAAIQPVQKRLVLNLDDLKLSTGLDNIEGIEFGPTLPDGSRSIVLVSDNNFSATQFTQILALSADLIPTVTPRVETKANLNDPTLPFSQRVDSDDPAIYVNPTDSANSLVLTAVKNGGLQVYDLSGTLLQSVNPGNIRYNNVDLIYGFELGGQKVDLAIASDRNNDKLVIFQINANATNGEYVTNITDSAIGTLFQSAPFDPPYSASARSAYGLAAYTSPVTDDAYVFVSRRQTGDVGQYKLIDAGNGKVTATRVREFTIELPFDSPAGTSPQTEGIVVDKELGYLYIAQEDVGIWKFLAEPNGGETGTLIDRTKQLGGKNITADAEGLTIYYGKNGTGYLLASSQGDSTFAAYTREGSNDFLGRFAVGNNGGIDSVQESDGADVINVPLGPNYPNGLFITQDGRNLPEKRVNGENVNTNFKFVPWENIANAFPTALQIDTTSYNPRKPQAQSLLNGIASGDTTQNSTVLWTRSNFTGEVTFEYSTTANFSAIAGTKTATVFDPLVPVKVEVDGLTSNTEYFYRAIDVAGATATGRFTTAAAIGTRTGLTFGAAGDWRGELSPYPAISNAPSKKLDLFIELGDTIYADYPSPALNKPQAENLDEYRIKHAEVYGTRFGQNTWADLRASTSILATIDDHEVINDFAGGELVTSDPRFDRFRVGELVRESALYYNGIQAFQEYNPIQNQYYNGTGDASIDNTYKVYRYNTYGSDAATYVLDARSYRNEALADVTNLADPVQVGTFLAKSFDPSRTLLGKQQVADLKQDLLDAEGKGVTWKYIVVPEPIQNLGVLAAGDRFEGYAAERTEILKFINDNDISNVVFISADIHGTLVNNLTYQNQVGGAQIATSAFEITTGSVGFDAPFGPTVAELGAAIGIITPQQKAFYDSLPTAGKDAFIKQIVDGGLQPLGYDPLGLDNNLAVANGKIDAKLLVGDYVATHVYGWTQFDVDATTQKLTVTTYGIPYYTAEDVLANPAAITSLTPTVVSQFEVNPTFKLNGTAGNDALIGTAGNDKIVGGAGNDFLRGAFGKDILTGGTGADTFVVEAGTGTDTITDFKAAEGDRIALSGGLTFGRLTFAQGIGANATDTLITQTGSSNVLAVLNGVQANSLTATDFTTV